MRLLYGARPVPYVAVRVTFIPLLVSLMNDLGDPVIDVGLAGFKSRANAFLLA